MGYFPDIKLGVGGVQKTLVFSTVVLSMRFVIKRSDDHIIEQLLREVIPNHIMTISLSLSWNVFLKSGGEICRRSPAFH